MLLTGYNEDIEEFPSLKGDRADNLKDQSIGDVISVNDNDNDNATRDISISEIDSSSSADFGLNCDAPHSTSNVTASSETAPLLLGDFIAPITYEHLQTTTAETPVVTAEPPLDNYPFRQIFLRSTYPLNFIRSSLVLGVCTTQPQGGPWVIYGSQWKVQLKDAPESKYTQGSKDTQRLTVHFDSTYDVHAGDEFIRKQLAGLLKEMTGEMSETSPLIQSAKQKQLEICGKLNSMTVDELTELCGNSCRKQTAFLDGASWARDVAQLLERRLQEVEPWTQVLTYNPERSQEYREALHIYGTNVPNGWNFEQGRL
ncbi:hypothetical protein TREMEDRAFT_60848 [Tremella mesenterica DSM 1558]|uniref:uncharacterized protein n=1 Tax=Tremella mesenterica (strain ATCC 24925 / CBS 8224 / DSM 1558 / NBRC 9311 / NRRL Y-6157 / RJB 2259-6 / UBC 559-6) TaxID=578456 RepID=UPI0003F4A441|nr:uncharacterized protein TREMEDRAFT_60848 [Tremella mesenterica DSM 1558]EIW70356.1 hypothetical protein TREMEDRAFT_60848 [Tremella mesenterica DSM 1558]